MTAAQPKILLLSASYGDGHNSAARHLAQMLEPHAQVLFADPCQIGNPRLYPITCQLYRHVINHLPRLWGWLYEFSNKHPLTSPPPAFHLAQNALGKLLDSFQPDLILTTYPIYPHLLPPLFQNRPRLPIFTVITDSIEVHSSWWQSPSDHFFVTDPHTQNVLLTHHVPAEKISVTGFPVSPRFQSLPTLTADASLDPLRILFFPTARSRSLHPMIHAILQHPPTQLTVVLGRNVRTLYPKIKSLKKEFPNRLHLKGWTKKVPEFLTSHHLVIGKAGGATVHEALAAQCPMLVHQIVPGQEEGNIELLQRYQTGSLTTTPAEIQTAIGELLARDGELWRAQKNRLQQLAHPPAAERIAQIILKKLAPLIQ